MADTVEPLLRAISDGALEVAEITSPRANEVHCGVSIRARDPGSLRRGLRGPSRPSTPREARVLAGCLPSAAEGFAADGVHRRWRAISVHAGGRRGRLRNTGRSGARGRDRTGPLP